ncbi:MAG TPA: prephenate dehydratase [Candidatus Limnocylindria bacterium]|nr:prephenate dehydratase [Candidatus Limnocylindria bacterium]
MTRVAYQGEPGAFGEEAVTGWFGDDVQPLPVPTFPAVMHAVESGEADAGVLPLENSLAGTVGDALDALADGALRVVGEVLLPVRHQLLVRPGTDLGAIRRVRSHWQALAQCERFLARHGWEIVPAADTAGAARELAADGDGDTAAIASRRAGERYGLEVAAADIQDADHNMTRFAILAPDAATVRPAGRLAPGGAERETLLTFETGHRPGDLYRALGVLAEAGINLSRIESRPSGAGPWRYRFLVQVAGDAEDDPLRTALIGLEEHTSSMRILGSFDAASGGA